jgi:serine/threonine-protein kinase RsbW
MAITRHADLDGSRHSPARARATVRQMADEAGLRPDAAEVLALLASELVTNAVMHGEPPIELDASVDGQVARVTVSDHDARMPSLRRPGPDDASGRGLAIVEALSSRWHAEPAAEGKRVWFELDAGLALPSSLSY